MDVLLTVILYSTAFSSETSSKDAHVILLPSNAMGSNSTTGAILKQLNAQLALARVASAQKQSDYTDLGIGGGGLKDYQPYQQALAEEKAIEDFTTPEIKGPASVTPI